MAVAFTILFSPFSVDISLKNLGSHVAEKDSGGTLSYGAVRLVWDFVWSRTQVWDFV